MPIATKPSGQITQNKLYFGSIDFVSIEDGLKPNFKCPECTYPFQSNFKAADVAVPDTFDFNQLVVFQCPNCGMKLALYIAVHKDADGTALCIQRSDAEGAGGIPANWWIHP